MPVEEATPETWSPIPPVGENVEARQVDPYHWLDRAFSQERPDKFPVSIELCRPEAALDIAGLTCTPAHAHSRFRTARASTAAFAELLKHPAVVRVQDATPLSLERRPRMPRQPEFTIEPCEAPEENTAATGPLLAVIDSGCPFAHADLRRAEGRTRIVRLWDQGSGARFGGLGGTPAGYDHGLELTGNDLDAAIASALGADGQVDEDACYRRCGYWPALNRTSHGAQSLGLMASDRRVSGRPWSVPRRTRRETPSVGAADVVFVQLPAEVLAAISVAALEHHALDAVRYIADAARALGHDRVVISFGFESWLGPHDGTSWFEQGIDSLIEEAAANDLQIDFVTVAGNAGDRPVHARCSGSAPVQLTLHVPPDNEAVTLVEIWAGSGKPAPTVVLTPPRGRSSPAVGAGGACCWSPDARGVVAAMASSGSHVLGTSNEVVVVRIGPTRSFDSRRSVAPSGLWKLTIDSDSAPLDDVDVYIGRSENPPDGSPRGQQAVFVGRTQDPKGSLNGHAGGRRALVAGAYRSHQYPDRKGRGSESPYSGRGPMRNGNDRPLDFLVAVDDGIYHKGSICIGNRSAVTSRLSGTSAAAPISARYCIQGAGTRPPSSKPKKPKEIDFL